MIIVYEALYNLEFAGLVFFSLGQSHSFGCEFYHSV